MLSLDLGCELVLLSWPESSPEDERPKILKSLDAILVASDDSSLIYFISSTEVVPTRCSPIDGLSSAFRYSEEERS